MRKWRGERYGIPGFAKTAKGSCLLCIHQRCADPQQGNQKESGFHVCLLAQMTSCCAILYRAQTLPCFRCNLYLCRCSTMIVPHGPFPGVIQHSLEDLDMAIPYY